MRIQVIFAFNPRTGEEGESNERQKEGERERGTTHEGQQCGSNSFFPRLRFIGHRGSWVQINMTLFFFYSTNLSFQ